ncbi:hypothetical protein DCAR_0727719 [Daucus carota subsp. sativus]|uniref:Uncharacterized protein n=1 Tax=Daucus carota subsp. sativus TaxID=79200 RepID=A0AAF0XKV1_DAUCS|nr:hypothetical protein DCAR_0727719 [Daucus carota subsp. sativus]
MATPSKSVFESSTMLLLIFGLVPLIFARPLDLSLASSASPSRLLMETQGRTATNTVAISATATAKASTFTRKDGGFQAVAHDVPSGPNPESN